MSNNPQSPNFNQLAPIDEQAWRLQQYRSGHTIAECDDDLARLKALDAAQAALQAAADRAFAERLAKADAMMAEQAAQAEENRKRLEASRYYGVANPPNPHILMPGNQKTPVTK